MKINELLQDMKEFFNSNKTKNVEHRIEQLKKLKNAVIEYKSEIERALYLDLHKPAAEACLSETGLVISEINYALNNIKNWAKPTQVDTPLHLKPAKSAILPEPFGAVLIIVPFNYPFQLALVPLIGAIAAGNCAVIKTSRKTPQVSNVLNKIISSVFDEKFVKFIMPNEISNSDLIEADFDYIFFTGSTTAAKQIAQEAAKRLIPYTLELGGKSPVIVDDTTEVETVAKKITRGKFMNAGQTCIAPDYLFCHFSIKDKLIEEIKKSIRLFYGSIPQQSPDYGRIISTEDFLRIKEIIVKENQNIIFGGKTDECGLYIEPTLINAKSFDSPCMQEEIFGPLLPVIEWSDINDVIDEIRKHQKPLALYVFSHDNTLVDEIVRSVSFGGGTVNDTMLHSSNINLPFGGVGASGCGRYHGKYSFDTFSHLKSMMYFDPKQNIDILNPPFDVQKMNLIRKFCQ